MELTINEALNQAIIAQKAGHFQKAESYYMAILRQQPDHPDVNHNMGVLAHTIGRIDKAMTFFEKCHQEQSKHNAVLAELYQYTYRAKSNA